MSKFIIKLGGSLITDKSKPMTARPEVIDAICKEIAELYRAGHHFLLIGNGAGSYGHYMVHKVDYKEDPSDEKRIAAVHNSVQELNNLIVKSLRKHGVPAESLSPHLCMRQVNDHVEFDQDKFTAIVDNGKVPVVYGDILRTDIGSRVISTEEALEVIATQLLAPGQKIDGVAYLTSVDGVLDPQNKVISRLYPDDILDERSTHGFDVTGGMKQKVAAGFKAKQFSEHVFIINGLHPRNLATVLDGGACGTELITESEV